MVDLQDRATRLPSPFDYHSVRPNTCPDAIARTRGAGRCQCLVLSGPGVVVTSATPCAPCSTCSYRRRTTNVQDRAYAADGEPVAHHVAANHRLVKSGRPVKLRARRVGVTDETITTRATKEQPRLKSIPSPQRCRRGVRSKDKGPGKV